MPEVASEPSGGSAECGFKFASFDSELCELPLRCSVVGMDRSLYVWLGKAGDERMGDLALAMKLPTAGSADRTVASRVIGAMEDEVSLGMARRLSQRLGIAVWLSYNLEPARMELVAAVEKWLKTELEKRRSELL